MGLLFLATFAISIMYLISQQKVEAEGFSASVVVCPDYANSTKFVELENNTCSCIDVKRAYNKSVSSVVAKEGSTVGRFIYNFF